MSDLQAIRRLKSGDIGGLEELVRKYQTRAIRAAFLVVHDEILAEDIVQDVFVRLYQRIHQYREERPFEPYLMRSVVNASLNEAQRREKYVSFDGDEGKVEALLSRASSVESDVEYALLKQKIIAALAALPPRERAAIVQRYYLEMNEKEMSAALGAPIGTVKWLLSSARAKLRKLLGSEGSGE